MISILIACEFSGVVRDAFIRQGYENTWSCDLLPSKSDFSSNHYQCDVREVMQEKIHWDLIIAHPDCTYLTVSANRYLKEDPGCYVAPGILTGKDRVIARNEALRFVRFFLEYPYCKHIAVENPVGAIGTHIRKASQYIQPYEFGEDVSKKTGLWLVNLPKLKPTKFIPPRKVGVMSRWSNQTDSGNIKRGKSKDRWIKNATTYKGVAEAMASQWGTYVEKAKTKKEK